MGWIDKVKNIISGLKASGKSRKEIEEIVQQAADKATVRTQDAMDAMMYAREMMYRHQRQEQRQQANNWRKMHGLPMKRKGSKRR